MKRLIYILFFVICSAAAFGQQVINTPTIYKNLKINDSLGIPGNVKLRWDGVGGNLQVFVNGAWVTVGVQDAGSTSGTSAGRSYYYPGYGLLMTDGGVFSVDTAYMASRARLKQQIDSILGLFGGEVKYADTAWQNTYQRALNATYGSASNLAFQNGLFKVGNTINANYGTPMWNANMLQSRYITAAQPMNGQTLMFDSTLNMYIWGFPDSVKLTNYALSSWVTANFYPLSSNPAGYLTAEVDATALAALQDTAAAIRADMGAGGGGSVDTTSLSNRIDLKLNIADTAAMLANYRHWQAGYLTKAAADGFYQPLGSYQAALSGTGLVKSTAGTIGYITDNSTNWTDAYNKKITSGSYSSGTLTLNQQDGGTVSVSGFSTATGGGTLTNVGTGYDVAVQGTSNVKRLKGGTGILLDSNTTANTVTIKADPSYIAYDTTHVGTYAQRVAIANPYVGQDYYQTNERIGLWTYNGVAWEHHPTNILMPQQATMSFSSMYSNAQFGTNSGISFTSTDTVRPAGISIGSGVSTNGYSYFTGAIGNNGGGPPIDTVSSAKARFVLYARVKINQKPTATDDFRLNLGWRTAGSVTNDSTQPGVLFTANYYRSPNDSLMISMNGGSNATYKMKRVIPLSRVVDGFYHNYVIVFSNRRAKFYIDGAFIDSLDITEYPVLMGSSTFFFGIFKNTGTTAVGANISDSYAYQTYEQ